MNMIKGLLALLLLGLTLGGATRGEDGAALGDWGHFLSLTPTVHFNNPEGKPFTITVHVMRWAKPDWNPNELTLRLVGPDGGIVVDGPQKLIRSAVTLDVKEAVKGVYRLHSANKEIWVETSLPQAVVWTGDQGANFHNFNDPITDEKTGKPREREQPPFSRPPVRPDGCLWGLTQNQTPSRAIGFEMLGNAGHAGQGFEPLGFIAVDAGGGGTQAGECGDARGIAHWRGDVGVGEEETAFCEPINVRRLHLRMTTETAHPVVHVVHDDHEDVGRW